jgi:hypothetical protein
LALIENGGELDPTKRKRSHPRKHSVSDILHTLGITLKSPAPGRYSTTCPQCSQTRRKRKDPCLGVTIDGGGVGWRCFHCGWTGGEYFNSPRPTSHRRIPAPQVGARSNDRNDRSRCALDIWHEAGEPRGTLVQQYLVSERGLQLADDICGDVIRFHPSLYYEGTRVGGMVALFRDIVTNEPCGIHRTFLDKAGRKLGRKMLGRAGGAAIKLDPDEDVTLGLHIGEGIESCLAARLFGFRPVWALGSADAIGGFPVLSGIEAVTVLGETGDGGANQRNAEACLARWTEAGQDALLAVPQIGGDLNDVWREVAP